MENLTLKIIDDPGLKQPLGVAIAQDGRVALAASNSRPCDRAKMKVDGEKAKMGGGGGGGGGDTATTEEG